MDQPEEHEENARNTFFEQLLTVRMPTAGPAIQAPSSQNAIADLDTAKQTAPPIGQTPIEQMPTARIQTTHPPVIVADTPRPNEANQSAAPRMTGAPAAAIEMPAITVPPLAPRDGVKAHSPAHRRRRIVVVAVVILVVVALTPVLYQLSSS